MTPSRCPAYCTLEGKRRSALPHGPFAGGHPLAQQPYYLHHKLVQAQAPGQVTRRSGLPSAR